VVAVHVHLEVSPSKAVALLNYCREGIIENLIKLGDHSRGQRIKAYQAMAETNGVPPIFTNTKKLLDYIEHSGGEKNVWDLVRYKPSTGTVEFRMFGATENIREIIGYVEACLLLRSKIN